MNTSSTLKLSFLILAGSALIGCSNATNGYGDSRYGYEYSEYSYEEDCGYTMACGYYMIPTYHVYEVPAEPEPVPVPVPEPESEPPVVIQTCPEGQFMLSDGTCAIMEVPTYEPPVISYPEPPEIPPEVYLPVRK